MSTTTKGWVGARLTCVQDSGTGAQTDSGHYFCAELAVCVYLRGWVDGDFCAASGWESVLNTLMCSRISKGIGVCPGKTRSMYDL